jgi:hypothetical protein
MILGDKHLISEVVLSHLEELTRFHKIGYS